MHVATQGFELTAQSIPPAILKNLKVLVLERVTVDSGVLAALLLHCHQLEELQLLRTRVEGPSQPLSVLSQLPSLSLTLDLLEMSLLEGQQPLAFLQHLRPCLTALHVDTWSSTQLQSTVLGYATRDLPRLQHLTVSDYTDSKAKREVLLGLASSPSAQQLETLSLNGIVLPDMECAVKLLCMPNLRVLGGKLLFPENDTPASLDMPWPEGKPPMELQLWRANARQLAALPLEHFSRISITALDLFHQQQQTMQALLEAARRCPEFVISSIGSYTTLFRQYPVPVLLPAIGPGCPIKLSKSGCFECNSVKVNAEGIQGVAAAWGPQLKQLIFNQATLASSAWAAITPTAFPALEKVDLWSHQDLCWVSDLSAFCMEWPADWRFNVAVRQSDIALLESEIAQELAAKLREMLKARGRLNITFTFEWQD